MPLTPIPLQSSLLYIVILKQYLHRISLCWVLLLPYQVFFVLLMSIQQILVPDVGRPFDFNTVLKMIWGKVCGDVASQFVVIYQSIACMVLIITFVLFITLKKPINQLDRRTPWLNKLIAFASVLIIGMEICLFNTVLALKRVIVGYLNNSDTTCCKSYEVITFGFCCLAIIATGLINYRIRILGAVFWLYLLLQGAIPDLQPVTSVIAILFCIFMIANDQEHQFLLFKARNLRKILHLMLIAFFVWKFISLIRSEEVPGLLGFIYLLIFMGMAIIIGVTVFVCRVNRRLPPVTQLCQCLQKLSHDPEDDYYKFLAYEIQHQYNTTHNQQLISSQYKIQQNPLQFQPQSFHKLVHIMIKAQYQRYPSLESGINMIKCRLMIRDSRLFEILDLLKELIGKYQDGGIRNRYEILKIALKVEEAYFRDQVESSGLAFPLILREVDRLNEKFYREAHENLQTIHIFWSKILQKYSSQQHPPQPQQPVCMGNQNSPTKIGEQILQINKGLRGLQKIVGEIQRLSLATRQEKVLKSIKRLCYQVSEHKGLRSGREMEISSFGIGENQDSQDGETKGKRDFLEFIQIVDGKIFKISLKLLTELGFKKLQVIGQPLTKILPKSYSEDLQTRLRAHQKSVYKLLHLVPIKCSDNTVLLKRIIAYLKIDYNSGYKIVLHFYGTYRSREPFFVYNTAANTIEYYNRAFMGLYCMNAGKGVRLQGFLNPDQIFADFDLNDRNIQSKLCEGAMESQYNCRMKVTKAGYKKTSILQNCRISLIEKEKCYMILKILKGHRQKTAAGEQTPGFGVMQGSNLSNLHSRQKSSSSYSSNIKMKSMANDLQGAYCKIQNPYQSKLNNKKQQLTNPNKFTYKFYAMLGFSLALFILLGQGVIFMALNAKIGEVLTIRYEDRMAQFEEYRILMNAYQKYFEQVLMKMEKDRVVRLVGQQGYEKMLNDTYTEIQAQIDQFQRKYLYSLLSPVHNKFPYSLNFTYFSIATDTSKSNLFDFSQNLLEYNEPSSTQFLLANYPTFSSLIYEMNTQGDDLEEHIGEYRVMYWGASGGIFVGVVLGLVVATVFRLKAVGVVGEMEWIYGMIRWGALEGMFGDLRALSDNLQEGAEERKVEYEKCQRLFDTSVHMVDTRTKQHIDKPVLSILNSNTDNSCENLDQLHYPQTQSLAPKFLNHEQSLQQHNKNVRSSILRNIGICQYIVFSFVLTIVCFVQVNYFENKIVNSEKILEFNLENRRIGDNVVHQILECQYLFITRANNPNGTNGANNRNQLDRVKAFVDKLTKNDKQLPQKYFDQYLQQYYSQNVADLCLTLQNPQQLGYTTFECHQIGGGILKYGLTRTIEYISQLLSTFIVSEYWFGVSHSGSLAQVAQIQYLQRMITAISAQNEHNFQHYHTNYKNVRTIQSIIIFVLMVGLVLVLALVSLRTKTMIYRDSQAAIGKFLILPNKALLDGPVLDHIRGCQLLERISKL